MNSLQGVWGPPNELWDPPRGEFRPLKVCPELQSSTRGRPPPPQAQLRGFSLLPKKKPHKKPPPKPKPTPKKNPNPRREISSSFCFFHPIKKGGGGGGGSAAPGGSSYSRGHGGGGGVQWEAAPTPRGRTTLTRTGRAPAQLHEDTWFAHAQRARTELTDGSGSASRKGAPLVFAVLCLRGCATVPWQPSLLRCRRSASSTASTLQGFPSGNESLRAWLRALRVPLSSPRCQEVIVQRFLIVSYPRGGSRAEQSTEQLRPPRPAARRSRWLVGSSRLGRNTR